MDSWQRNLFLTCKSTKIWPLAEQQYSRDWFCQISVCPRESKLPVHLIIGTLSYRRFRWRRRRDKRQGTGDRTVSGCGHNCELPSLSKACEKRDAAPIEIRKFGCKFKIHNKALDFFALSGHVELEGNAIFTFGFLYQKSHKGKWICHSLRRNDLWQLSEILWILDVYTNFALFGSLPNYAIWSQPWN